RRVRDRLERSPTGFGHALCAVDLYLSRVLEVAVVGDPGSEGARRLAGEVWRRFIPGHVMAAGRPGDPAAEAIPLLAGRPTVDGVPAAYVCERLVCKAPVPEAEQPAAQVAATYPPTRSGLRYVTLSVTPTE